MTGVAPTKISIISNAVSKLGHAPIVSLDDQDLMVTTAEQAFDMLYPAIISANNWRFAVGLAQLSLLNITPPSQWQAVYQLPSGWLKTIRTFPNIYVWDIYNNNQIFAQYSGTWWMEYVFLPDISNLPAHFIPLIVTEIAYYLSTATAFKADFAKVLAQEKTMAFAMAAAIEAQNRPQFSLQTFPVLDNRNLGTIIGNSISF